ncbi:MAG: hypothetical protein IID46_15385 [Planctomycetes bacterium]|nr:hypothetical protein [Planctomycetota bacterium]
MGLFIGMDEAGYGPNLGPLVVTVTAWEVPGEPSAFDFWNELNDVVTQSPVRGDPRLHIADSKQVYTPARGLKSLERSVLSAVNLAGFYPAGFRELYGSLIADEHTLLDVEPWFRNSDLKLPTQQHAQKLSDITERWKRLCDQRGIRLCAIKSDVVLTERFNRLTRDYDSKGVALSRISLRLLRSVWNPDETQPVLIVADKHGGRNRYDGLLDEVLDGRMIFRGREGKERSTYKVGNAEVRFQMKAESHFPVALASMVSKYVRELAMTLFNRFWQEHLPDLKPTKGYPQDARRFRQEIAEVQSRLGIPDDVLWRAR